MLDWTFRFHYVSLLVEFCQLDQRTLGSSSQTKKIQFDNTITNAHHISHLIYQKKADVYMLV